MTEPLLDRKPFIVTGNCGDERTDRIGKLQTFFRFKTMQITVQVAGIKAVTRSYRVNRRNRESLFVNPLMIMIQRRT